MNPITLAEVAALLDGALIYSVRARAKTVYGRSAGVIAKGPDAGRAWTQQRIDLEDGGIVVTALLEDREELSKTWQGLTIELACVKGANGLDGVTAFDDTYRGKTTRKIKVTPAAEIALIEGAPEEPPKAEESAPKPEAPKYGRFTAMSYGRTVNLGNYENFRLEMTVEITVNAKCKSINHTFPKP